MGISAEHAAHGDRITSVLIEQAIKAAKAETNGWFLGFEERADIGEAMATAYRCTRPGMAVVEGAVTAPVVTDMAADLLHSARWTVTPDALFAAAVVEMNSAVNVVPVLCRLGEDGRLGILASALASVLALGDTEGINADEIQHGAETRFYEEAGPRAKARQQPREG
ncbi:hypothetical protein [Streptomyces sp. NRRL WC-3742]|uniref:hypothetical protein n=1 Tax=Streptomyces sp. NRRL WC-3742 TaxID=1463934 RepID=UPI0004C6EC47|nr:hypothetical protein [Streptomyces sp. NRRL WC-3742]